MKKIYSTILMVLCAVNLLAGTEFTFTAAADMNQTKDGVTVVLAQGNGQSKPEVKTDYETQSPEMRLYLNNTITVSSSETLKNIQLVCAKSSASNKEYADMSANAGKLDSGGVSADKNDWKVDTWTGEAKEVVFTLTGKGQRRIKQLVVNGDLVEIVDPEQPLPTENDLDWSYEYVEPEYIHVPDTQIFHKEYAFIDGNILVHCDSGSIVKASKTEDAYFGVMANQKITFTATQVIKGIAINGNVRKNFSASCDRGFISFLTDENIEMAGDPVLVIRNINDMSVTITCDKNLSCYGARVYFEENPDPLDNEVIDPETINLVYDTASVVLDPEESEAGKYVYSLYIWDKTNEDIYLTLDINTPTDHALVGTYSIEKGNMTTESFFQYGEDYMDYSYATTGEMTITKSNGLYTINGFITCENYNTYNFNFSGVIDFDGDDEEGIEDVQSSNRQSSIRKFVKDGQIYIQRENKTYTIFGTQAD